MKLYLARHGEYLTNDLSRGEVLSEQGIQAVTELSHFIKPMQLAISHIFHSGKPRAQETADILSQGFIHKNPPQVKKGLLPQDDIALLLSQLSEEDDDMLLVSHLPFLNRLSGKLVTGEDFQDIIVFHPGTLVCLEKVNPDRWAINWVLNPILFTKTSYS
jgi:phosphohistidine phosphatase